MCIRALCMCVCVNRARVCLYRLDQSDCLMQRGRGAIGTTLCAITEGEINRDPDQTLLNSERAPPKSGSVTSPRLQCSQVRCSPCTTCARVHVTRAYVETRTEKRRWSVGAVIYRTLSLSLSLCCNLKSFAVRTGDSPSEDATSSENRDVGLQF